MEWINSRNLDSDYRNGEIEPRWCLVRLTCKSRDDDKCIYHNAS